MVHVVMCSFVIEDLAIPSGGLLQILFGLVCSAQIKPSRHITEPGGLPERDQRSWDIRLSAITARERELA